MTRVSLGPRSYDIAFAGDGPPLGAFAGGCLGGRRALVVGDANTVGHRDAVADALSAVGFTVERTSVPAGEASKCMAEYAKLLDALASMRADRQTAVVAVGGGVVGDLAGFAAATYNRGLPLFMVPTTLLAMVDSAVGGKVGINHPAGKNLIGAFHQPRGVWIDPAVLTTLPDREYRSGLAEVVKYGVILDAAFFEWLEANAEPLLAREAAAVRYAVERSCQLKAQVVEADEREETDVRAVLNYGHTFAHAFEAVAGYGAWLHGEAVAAGMVCASRLAERLGWVDATVTGRQRVLLEAFGLPVSPDPMWPADDLLAAMARDKKAAAGRLRFVLPREIGRVEVTTEGDPADVRAALS